MSEKESKGRKKPALDPSIVRSLRDNGLTVAEISKALGYSEGYLYQLLRQFEAMEKGEVEAAKVGTSSIDRELAARLYRDGLSLQAIASRLGTSRPTIRRIVTEMGVKVRSGGNRNQIGRYKAMASAYKGGLSVEKVAQQFGVHHGTVSEALRQTGTPIRPASSLDSEEVVELYASGLTQEKVAQQVGVHTKTVARVLRREGVSPNKRHSFDRSRAVLLYEAGVHSTELAKIFDVSPQGIRKALKEEGVAIREPHRGSVPVSQHKPAAPAMTSPRHCPTQLARWIGKIAEGESIQVLKEMAAVLAEEER